jgi:two-component system OmpR family response regulator
VAELSRILIVDDEPDTVGLIEITLGPAGYMLESAYSALDAKQKIKNVPFDLILLDVMMPDTSGFDLVRELQQDGMYLPPIIFLTARGRQEDIEAGNSLGAKGYLVKPVTRGRLLDAIKAALYESA